LGPGLCSTTDQIGNILQAISTYIHECRDFETDPEHTKTFIFLDSFGSSSIAIKLYCFTKTTVWGEWLAVKVRLAYKIKEIVENEKASFAFPSCSIYVESLPFGQVETFPLQSSDKPVPHKCRGMPSPIAPDLNKEIEVIDERLA
jgi:MscS family membrane protein